MARTVRLRQEWTLGQRIGDPSGFGEVFAATAADGTDGVVKLIAKRRGASRELLFEELAGVPNVVPIIDSGETTGARGSSPCRARIDRSAQSSKEPGEDSPSMLRYRS
jgi:hypothetical protein